jgi:predicted metal-dependent phosphotriesterase family hydrolase
LSVPPGGNDRAGGQILTVLGPIEPNDLGITLSHEHLLCDLWSFTQSYSFVVDDEALAIEEAHRFRAAGGGAICDPTNIGLGRNPNALRRISEQAGIHIVMGCGWYRERVYPQYIHEEGPDQLADRLVHELVEGVEKSGIRPGFIGEIGTERFHITPVEERVFRAAARAHRRIGAPIMTHTTHFGELALEQLDLLEEEGVSPARVIVSHLAVRPGLRGVLPIAERGAWLGIDNLGFVAGYAPLEVRADNVVALWDAGYGDRILLSSDICTTDQLAFYGGPGYTNVVDRFLPLLLKRGLTPDDVAAMTVKNPSRAFAYEIVSD